MLPAEAIVINFYFQGNSYLDNVAWYQDNSDGQTHFVKQKLPNSFGLYDMAGNVSEWCADYYGPYSASTKINPQGPTSGTYRIIRGGSFNYSTIYCRLSYRDNGNPTQNILTMDFDLLKPFQLLLNTELRFAKMKLMQVTTIKPFQIVEDF